MAEGWTLLLLAIVSILWGITNPLLKRASVGIENIKAQNFLSQLYAELIFLGSRLSYVGPFLLNQLGSLLFVYSLSLSDLSLVVPITNSFTFIITIFIGHLLGEEVITQSFLFGTALVCVGISMCVADKALQS